MAKYWASCAPGLQFALVAELQELEGTVIICDSLILGGVMFSTSSSPTEVFKLRSADNVYAFLGKHKGVPSEKELAMKYLKELAGQIDWEDSLDLFWKWKNCTVNVSDKNNSTIAAAEKNEQKSMTFRVSCDRACVVMRKHAFTSMEAAAALGEGVCNRFGWRGDMLSYDLEVLAWIRDDEIVLALALLYSKEVKVQTVYQDESTQTEVQQKSCKKDMLQVEDEHLNTVSKRSRAKRIDTQLYARRKYRNVLVTTSLKPSVAYALLQLGNVHPGNIVLDPMCGCGTIPLEAADWLGNNVYCIGGDISLKAVDAAYENLTCSGFSFFFDISQWSASRLPLREGVIDRIICDMPFGVRCGTSKSRESLCPKVLKEIIRVLQPGIGIAVLLGQSKAVRIEVQTKQMRFLELRKTVPIRMEGLCVEVLVVQRTLEPYGAL